MDGLYTIQDLMDTFGVSRPTVARYMSKWGLGKYAIQVGREVRFREQDIDKWVREMKIKDKWPIRATGRKKRVSREEDVFTLPKMMVPRRMMKTRYKGR